MIDFSSNAFLLVYIVANLAGIEIINFQTLGKMSDTIKYLPDILKLTRHHVLLQLLRCLYIPSAKLAPIA